MPTDATTEAEQLLVPLTELEKAQLASAATEPDHQLSRAGVMLLRRLLFQTDVAEQQGYRRGVADAAKVCDERKEARKGMTDSAYVSGMEAGGCAAEIRERLGGEAT